MSAADARVERGALGRVLGEPRPLRQHVGQLGHLPRRLVEARELGEHLGIALLGGAQRAQRGDGRGDRAQLLVQAGRLHQQALARLWIELDRRAPLQDRRRARRIGRLAVVALEGGQRVDVLGIGLEDLDVEPLGRRPFAGRLLVEVRGAQRQLARGVGLGRASSTASMRRAASSGIFAAPAMRSISSRAAPGAGSSASARPSASTARPASPSWPS